MLTWSHGFLYWFNKPNSQWDSFHSVTLLLPNQWEAIIVIEVESWLLRCICTWWIWKGFQGCVAYKYSILDGSSGNDWRLLQCCSSVSLLRLQGTATKLFLVRSKRPNEDKEPRSQSRAPSNRFQSLIHPTFSRSIDPTKKAVAILLLVMSVGLCGA